MVLRDYYGKPFCDSLDVSSCFIALTLAYALAIVTILGSHVSLSFLRKLANNNTSSLIKVSMVCLFPTFILGISTILSKYEFNFLVKSPV